MPYYLMRFDRETLAEPEIETFDDGDQAVACLNEAEISAPDHVEVVLFSAPSKKILRRTHSSYFSHSGPENRRSDCLPPDVAKLVEMPHDELMAKMKADLEQSRRKSEETRQWLEDYQRRMYDDDYDG